MASALPILSRQAGLPRMVIVTWVPEGWGVILDEDTKTIPPFLAGDPQLSEGLMGVFAFCALAGRTLGQVADEPALAEQMDDLIVQQPIILDAEGVFDVGNLAVTPLDPPVLKVGEVGGEAI